MEIVIAAVAAVAGAGIAWALRGRHSEAPARITAPGPHTGGPPDVEQSSNPGDGSGTELNAGESQATIDAEVLARREEIVRLEERALRGAESVEVQLAELDRRARSLDDRARNLDGQAEELKQAKRVQLRELERIAGLSAAQARQLLLKQVEDEARHQAGRMVSRVEEEARQDAERRVRNILAIAMQRLAGTQAGETTVRLVELPGADMKGRIIGKDGRNIRALENITGVDFIIDETPSAVLLSCFDGMRREIARLTLEKLIADGRIHPARIEETYEQARAEIDAHVIEQGERAVLKANVQAVHPELVKLLGRLSLRTSYGQNVLEHSIECAHLASMMADELGASAPTARRAALMHDIGKAVTHEMEGPHALIGGKLARRYGEAEAVAHAMEAHHNEVELRTVEAVLVQAADAVSGSRPGARGESLERYVKRLKDLETIATRHPGVERVYAMQAGREVRVMVDPGQVDDDAASLVSHEIAREIEKEVEYAGQIKITVIRESRATSYAK